MPGAFEYDVATHLSDDAYLTPCGGRTREVRQSTATTRVLSVSPFSSRREVIADST